MKKLIAILTLVLAIGATESYAQCKVFTKRDCIPQISPYINNGQFNGATLFAGESASLIMTFYSGQDYRLLVCAQAAIKGAYFIVKDATGNALYNSQEGAKNFWDFNVATTQQMEIEVTVPDAEGSGGVKPNGCVSILLGFKE